MDDQTTAPDHAAVPAIHPTVISSLTADQRQYASPGQALRALGEAALTEYETHVLIGALCASAPAAVVDAVSFLSIGSRR